MQYVHQHYANMYTYIWSNYGNNYICKYIQGNYGNNYTYYIYEVTIHGNNDIYIYEVELSEYINYFQHWADPTMTVMTAYISVTIKLTIKNLKYLLAFFLYQ